MRKTSISIYKIRPKLDEDWRNHAACKGEDSSIFYLEDGQRPSKKLRDMCANCQVRVECLHYAIKNNEQYGIWGGLGHRKRLEYAKENGIAPINNGNIIYNISL